VVRAVPALSLVGVLLVGCAAKPVARQPLVVQTETIGEASFSPSIDVMSQLESTTDVRSAQVFRTGHRRHGCRLRSSGHPT